MDSQKKEGISSLKQIKYSFIGYIKMSTIEIVSHKTECINRFKKDVEYRFAGVY